MAWKDGHRAATEVKLYVSYLRRKLRDASSVDRSRPYVESATDIAPGVSTTTASLFTGTVSPQLPNCEQRSPTEFVRVSAQSQTVGVDDKCMKKPKSDTKAIRRVGTAISAAVMLVALTAATGSATASSPIGRDGVVHACVVVKGKKKGTIRVVPRAVSCKKRDGQRAIAWSMGGPDGTKGAVGPQGATSAPGSSGTNGANGVAGAVGPAGQIEKSVLETIQTQSTIIDELTKQVTTLETSLIGVEGTLEGACTQLTNVTNRPASLKMWSATCL
jgi:hypothetical protein